MTAHGGLSGGWGLEPDFLTVGKAIAAGVPLGAYGMSDEIAALIAPPEEARAASGVVVDQVATGGTLFANPLSMAAGRAALTEVLTEVLTEDAFDRTAVLGEQMASGLRTAIGNAGLGWSVTQIGAHAFYFFRPEPPDDGATARTSDNPDLRALLHVFMVNRGVWESGWWLGPTVSVAHDSADVDRYVIVFEEFLDEVT